MSGKSKAAKQQRKEWYWGWFLVFPTMAGLLILNIIPIFQTVYLSFFKSGAFGKGNIFVGFENYKTLINDPQVWGALRNTFLYMLGVVPVALCISLLLAALLNTGIRSKGVFRTIYFLPMVTVPAAATMVWKWLYNNNFGLINYTLKSLGLEPVNWLNTPHIALIAIIVIGIWSTVGHGMILLLAGMQNIPRNYYEAASIDGASGIRAFFSITLPLVSPTMFFVVVTNTIAAMKVFDFIYLMIGTENPAYESSVSLVYLFYNQSFVYMNKGYGSAIILLLLVVIMLITFLQNYLQKKWVHYN